MFGRRLSCSVAITASWLLLGLSAPLLVAQTAVDPDGATPKIRANATSRTARFDVWNFGTEDSWFFLNRTCQGAVISCSAPSPSSVFVPVGQSAPVDVTFATGAPQIGSITLTADNLMFSDQGTYIFTVQDSTLPTSSSITINPTPHNGDYRDVKKCVAECFDASVSYTTPAYISMDVPRSVTLLYRSSQGTPLGFVQVDAADNTSPAPGRMSIRLKRPDQNWVTFTNGSQEIFYASGAGTSRLAAQFDASSLSTGAYNYTVVARSWRGEAFQEATYPIRVLIVNEQSSPFGWGWTISGFQKLYIQSDGSVVITEGDGSIAFFQINECPSNCSFVSPAGDFTSVATVGQWPSTTGYERRYPDGTTLTFSTAGRLTSARDRFNNQTSFAYDGLNRLNTITDPANKGITLGYGADGKLDWVRDPANRQTLVTINAAFDVAEIKDPANVFALRPTYDAQHRITTRLDRRGSAWVFGYDFASKAAADTMPTIVADNQSVRPVTQFASLERAVLVDPGSGLGSSGSPAPRVLPSAVRVSVTNPRGFSASYALDRFGAATRIEEPLGRVTKLGRNSHSQVTSDTAPSGRVVDYTWIGVNLTRTVDRATGRTINMSYEPVYNELSLVWGDTDSLRNWWSGGKLDSMRAKGQTTKFRYDARGRDTLRTDPRGHGVLRRYDATGFMNTKQKCAFTCTNWYTYDAVGRVATDSVPSAKWRYSYDEINRKTSAMGPLADTTVWEYDSLYLRSVRDAKGQVYRFVRNALGWVESDTSPVGLAGRRYAYDRNGNLTSAVNRRGQTVTFTYDSLNQMRTRVADSQTTTFYVHPLGVFTTAGNNESTDTVRLDSAGRVDAQIAVRAGTRYELRAGYNIRDLRTMVRIASPWADTISYRYNQRMQLDTLIDLVGGRTRFTYDADGLPLSTVLPPGFTFTYGFPATHKPSQIEQDDLDINRAIGAQYGYNSRGWVADRINVDGTAGRDFEYDARGRLTQFRDYTYDPPADCLLDPSMGFFCPPNKLPYRTVNYTYDKVGNRTDLGAVVSTGNRLTRLNGDSLVYDADGNLITRIRGGAPVQRLYWNSLGQLIAVWTSGADSVTFAYDAVGRRARKWTSTRTTRYIWDGDDLFAEVDSAGSRLAEYAYYPGIDRPHSVRRRATTDSTYYYAQDFPGNITGLISSTKVLVTSYLYFPSGDTIPGAGTNTFPNTLRFAARELDTETGLYYIRARYYDPQIARFISEDPIGLDGGINGYVYAANNPVNYADPTGNWCIWIDVSYGGSGNEITQTFEICHTPGYSGPAPDGVPWGDQTLAGGIAALHAAAMLQGSLVDWTGHTFFIKSPVLVGCPLTASFAQHWMRTRWPQGGDPRYVQGDVNIERVGNPSSRLGGWAYYGGHILATQVSEGRDSESPVYDGFVVGSISCRSGAGTLHGFQLVIDAIP